MARRNELGNIRRSAIIMNYGPGAIIDFRSSYGGASISVVSAGLEQWEEDAKAKGLSSEETIFEPRLQKKLKVSGFKLPPVYLDERKDNEFLKGVRFPRWLQCSSCDTIADTIYWASEPGDPARFCPTCSANRPRNKRAYVVPVRFVTACQKGHLDDFPWHFWVNHNNECSHRDELHLKSDGPGLAGLKVSCPKCKSQRSLEGIFNKKALVQLNCRGKRPWLANADQNCDLTPVVMQRGASNIYFPQIESALDIPPWSDVIQQSLGQYWDPITKIEDPAQRKQFIKHCFPMFGMNDKTVDDVNDAVNERLDILKSPEGKNIRWAEYLQLTKQHFQKAYDDFEVRHSQIPGVFRGIISQISRVVRLREVRALTSFTRIESTVDDTQSGTQIPVVRAELSKKRFNWLPAIEVRGEGIFIELDNERLRSWSNQKSVIERTKKIFEFPYKSQSLDEDIKTVNDPKLCARFLLIHTLSHIIMKQLALESGYSTASLRERLFVGLDPYEMNGLLIFTASTDSDGTLGGLQRQGKKERFEKLFLESLRSSEWCSSDPICIEDLASASDSSNLAACHSCVLAPETSCEEFNRFLDRAMVCGTDKQPELGFFREVITKHRLD